MSERRVALVIGVGQYLKAPPLVNPINDASRMTSVLKRLGFDMRAGLDVIHDDMEKTITEFEKSIEDADVALLYFAGHGVQIHGENYLLPKDAPVDNEFRFKRKSFALNEILAVMRCHAKICIVFLDACRDNPFAQSLAMSWPAAERNIRRGLAEVKAPRDCFIAFATAPGEIASDGHGQPNSPFTSELLKYIETPNLTINDMMIDVANGVRNRTNNLQQPWVQTNLAIRFYFRKETSPATVDAENDPPDQRLTASAANSIRDETAQKTMELAHWDMIKERGEEQALRDHLARYLEGVTAADALTKLEELIWARLQSSTDIASLKGFLNEFPNGRYAAAARSRLATLEKQAAETAEKRERPRESEAVLFTRRGLIGSFAVAAVGALLVTAYFGIFRSFEPPGSAASGSTDQRTEDALRKEREASDSKTAVTKSDKEALDLQAAQENDLAAWCVRVGDDDTIRRYSPSLGAETVKAFKTLWPEAKDVPGDDDLKWQASFRCMNGKVFVCLLGANLTCGKTDTARENLGANEFCLSNPNADNVPMSHTGHDTNYSYRCHNGRAEVSGQLMQPWELDKRGFPKDQWQEIPTSSSGGSGYYLQLRSRNDQQKALAEIANIQQKYAFVLGNYRLDIKSIDLDDKGVWFRIRVGPVESKEAANDLCRKLRSAGFTGLTNCFVRSEE